MLETMVALAEADQVAWGLPRILQWLSVLPLVLFTPPTPQRAWGPVALSEWGSEQVRKVLTSYACAAWVGNRAQVLQSGLHPWLAGPGQTIPLLCASVSLSAQWE